MNCLSIQLSFIALYLIAANVSQLGGAKVPYPVNRGWKTLIDFTARDNPKVKDVKVEEILDDSIVKELDESGYVKSLGLK